MDRFIYLACILAGFALLKVPLAGTFLASFSQIITFIGILAIVVFSFVILYKGVKSLIGK